jgi:C4-dicarboxylate-specific signal transduction histidine kinase
VANTARRSRSPDCRTRRGCRQLCTAHYRAPAAERAVLLLRGEPLATKGFVTLYSDITEQRYIENLTEHQNIQLEERVRRRTAQLENANANLTRPIAKTSVSPPP